MINLSIPCSIYLIRKDSKIVRAERPHFQHQVERVLVICQHFRRPGRREADVLMRAELFIFLRYIQRNEHDVCMRRQVFHFAHKVVRELAQATQRVLASLMGSHSLFWYMVLTNV